MLPVPVPGNVFIKRLYQTVAAGVVRSAARSNDALEPVACCVHARLELRIGVLPQFDELAVVLRGFLHIAALFVEFTETFENPAEVPAIE
jgi:hypothetical protein